MLKIENLDVFFGDFQALKNVNIEIPEGEFFTFLGPSGCGKTTTLRAITGFIKPKNGRIIINEKEITDIPVEKRNIGMVFQSYALFPTMSVYQNIAFSLKIQRKSKIEIDNIVREIAKKVDLTDEQLIKNVTELSGGQQQRVAIARALASNPPILCLDEPLSNLDAKLRVQLREELKDLQRKLKITMIYVTHDQEEALTLSDHICVFRKGEVDQIGTPYEIYNNSKTEYTFNFIGDNNKLSEKLVKRFNEISKSNKIDTKKNSYIRLEKVTINNHKNKAIVFKGKILNAEYFGMYAKFYVQVDDDLIKVIRLNSFSDNLKIGDEVTLGFNYEDILSFSQNEKKEEKAVNEINDKPKNKLLNFFKRKNHKEKSNSSLPSNEGGMSNIS